VSENTHELLIDLDDVSLHLPVPRRMDRSRAKDPGARNAGLGGTITRGFWRSYVQALQNITLRVRRGERIAVLGHNGAGKTSLLRVISGIYQPTSGQRAVTGKVSALFTSTIGLDLFASGLENIRFACALYGVPSSKYASIIQQVEKFSELGDYLHLPVRAYSSGMRTRLGFSIVTSMDPDILIIDEVLSAGDMVFAERARERVIDFVDKANVIIVASHSANLMRMFCTRAVWLEGGRVEMEGDFETVWDAYYESKRQPDS